MINAQRVVIMQVHKNAFEVPQQTLYTIHYRRYTMYNTPYTIQYIPYTIFDKYIAWLLKPFSVSIYQFQQTHQFDFVEANKDFF